MIGNADKTARLLGMARTAELAGNDDEAISYYNRVLEDDPTMSDAWLGKGRAVGRKSTLANMRLRETLVAFGNAIGAASDADRPGIAGQALGDLVTIADALWGAAWQHYRSFPAVDGQWASCVATGAAILDVLDDGRAWSRGDRGAGELAMRICKQILDQGVPPDDAVRLKARWTGALAEIRMGDPAFEAPALAQTTVAQRMNDEQNARTGKYIAGCMSLALVVVVVTIVGG